MNKPKSASIIGGSMTRMIFFLGLWSGLSGVAAYAGANDKHESGAAATGDHREEAPLKLEALRAQGVVTAKVARHAADERLAATAEIAFNESRRVAVSARAGGWVERVVVFANQRVARDALLAELYSPEFLSAQQEYLLIAARVRTSPDEETKGLLRDAAQRLRVLGLTNDEVQQLGTTREPFPYLHVHSPIAATVVEHRVNAGDTVQAGQELYVLADLRTVWANIALTEAQIAKVKAGQAVDIAVKAYPDARFPGRIVSIGAGMDDTTRTVSARAVVTNSGQRLKPGMFADVEIHTASGRRVLAVPVEAIVRLDGRDTAFKREGDELHPQAVELGETRGKLIEVRAGLAEGDEIAVKGTFLLKSLLLKSQMGEGHGH